MATININGEPPEGGQPQSGGAPPSGPFKRLTQAPEYAKALAQQAKQAAEAMAKMRQENAAYTQYEREGEKEQAKLNRVTRDEIRERERQLRDKKKADDEIERRRKADERAEDQLRRRQQMEAMQRGQQEWALRRTYGNLAHRAAWHLSPTAHRSLQRQSAVFGERLEAFSNRWGRSAEYGGDINALKGGLGSMEGAYRVQNIMRLGSMGQRYADTREWVGLAKVESELRRIEKVNREQLQFAKSPTEQATLHRQEAAILGARQRISAARAGNSRMMNLLGGGIGQIGMMLTNPELALAASAVSTAVTAPYVANRMYAGLLGAQQPYTDFRIKTAMLGLGGGFSGADLADTILPSGALSYAPRPGMGRSTRMQALGLGPQDVLRNLAGYGVAPRSPEDALNIAASIRQAYLAPGIGLPEDQLAKFLGQGRTLGAVAGGAMFNRSANAYWNQLEKVMTTATGQGVDRSSAIRTMVSLQAQNAVGGALTANTSGFASLYGRLLGSGMPSMRNGEGVVAVSQATQTAMQGLGTQANIPGSIIMSSIFQQHGGAPKSEEALRKMLGVSKQDWANNWVSTPGAQQALQSYLDAAKSGNGPLTMQYLGQLLGSHPNTVNNLFESSAFSKLGPALTPIARQNFQQITLGQSLALQSTNGNGVNYMPGADTNQRRRILMDRLQRDLQLTPEQAAGLTGDIAGEGLTLGNEKGKPYGQGGFGLAQWTGSRRKAFFAWAAANGYDPNSYETQVQYIEQELRTTYAQTLQNVKGADNPIGAANAGAEYEFGHDPKLYAAHLAERQQMAEETYTSYRNGSPVPFLQKNADLQTSQLKSAEYVSNITDAVVFGFTKASEAAHQLAIAAQSAAAALQRIGKGKGAGPATGDYQYDVPGGGGRGVLK